MTELEYLASEDPAAMLLYRQGSPHAGNPADWEAHAPLSDRKLRLFVCACCWAMLGRWVPHSADLVSLVITAEQVADGLVGSRERGLAFNKTDLIKGPQGAYARGCLRSDSAEGVREILAEPVDFEGEIFAGYSALLRDIAGNPWRPVSIGQDWRPGMPAFVRHGWVQGQPLLTPTVLSLAHAAYDERLPDGTLDPVRLAVLADALEEAGCTHADILNHLRSPAPHVRGCWAVDLILGKE